MPGPLAGVRVLEFAGLAPAPYCGLILSDFGADVVRLDPAHSKTNGDTLTRGKRSIAVALKSPEGLALAKSLLAPAEPGSTAWRADVLIDPFRPGVLERLGLDPVELLKVNPKLIISRITGFRREGPYAKMAGHDINYVAISGVLHMLGQKGGKPTPPINILGDFAGGGLMAAFGVALAIAERNVSGKGQIVETDMVTSVRYISSFLLTGGKAVFDKPRGQNLLDGGSPFYNTYETKDGGYMSVGALEPQFYTIFLNTLLSHSPDSIIPSPRPTPAAQHDLSSWPYLATYFAAAFKLKTREEWTKIYIGTDACTAPVLEPSEIKSSGAGPLEDGQGWKTGKAGTPDARPVLVRSPGFVVKTEQKSYNIVPGTDTKSFLENEAGLSAAKVAELLKNGVVAVAKDSKL